MFLGDIHGTNSNTKKFRTDHQTSHCTVIQNILKSGRCYWATRLSARSFARTAHSFACSALLASLKRSAALIRSLAPPTHSLPSSWDSGIFMSGFSSVLDHRALSRRHISWNKENYKRFRKVLKRSLK